MTKSKLRRAVMLSQATTSIQQESNSHAVLTPQMVNDCRTMFENYGPVPGKGLPVAKTQRFLADLDISMSENEVKDLMFGLLQTNSVETRNAEVERAAMSAKSSARSSNKDDGDAGKKTADLFLPFRLFLEVLTMTFDDCDKESELRSVWKLVDGDGDGVVNYQDLQSCMANADCDLPPMTAEEVRELLREVDFDNDGNVTYDDFTKVLDTN